MSEPEKTAAQRIASLTLDGDMWIDDEGVAWTSRESFVGIALLGFCGCGAEDEALEFVLEALEAFGDRENGYKRIRAMVPDNGMGAFVLYQFDHHGLIEHGSTVRASWLTDDGKAVLAFLREWKVRDGETST